MKKTLLFSLGLLIYTANSMAATIQVNTINWSVQADDGLCTLYEAVDAVNMNLPSGATPGECVAGDVYPAVDEINFDLDLFPAYILIYAPFELKEPVKIIGPPIAEFLTINSQTGNRVFVVQNFQPAAYFEISGMALEGNGLSVSYSDYGAAILSSLSAGSELLLTNLRFFNNTSERGGGALGISGLNPDNLTTIKNCTFVSNRTLSYGNITTGGGGAIFIGANQHVVIENSTFYNNTVENSTLTDPQADSAGGAILMRSSAGFPSTLKITRSTFSNNWSDGVGGAIALGGPGYPADISELALRHSTITLNLADTNTDQTGATSSGGGLWSSSSIPVSILNTIIAVNTDSSDTPAADLKGLVDSSGYNFIGDNSASNAAFPAGQPNANKDWVGTAAAVLNPNLQVLADWGGPTLTHLPNLFSLTIDQGSCTPQAADQRYFYNSLTGKRPVDIANYIDADDGCDIGAVEALTQSSNPVPIAVDDIYNALEGQLLSINAASGLLSNDIDADPLLVISAGQNAATGAVAGVAMVVSDGAFTYNATDADANGLSTFTYQISDGFNSNEASVVITVIAVNDAPQFSAATTAIGTIAGQPYTYPLWATNISRGPADEAGQTLMFIITPVTVPGGFFTSVPAVNTVSGQLSFEINASATGSAQVKVLLQDNGGMANGGMNKSSEVFLTITATTTGPIFEDGFESAP